MAEIELFPEKIYKFAPCIVSNVQTMEMKFLKRVLASDVTTDGGNYFCDDTPTSKADIVVVSVPWSVTADYGRGATYTPDAVIEASAKGGDYDTLSGLSLKGRIATAEIDYNIQELSEQLGRDAERVAQAGEGGSLAVDYAMRKVKGINEGFGQMHRSTYEQVLSYAKAGKRVAVVGGDHSVSYGAVKALAEQHNGIGVLFVDAHTDFVGNGEVYNFSHRTIARNIVEDISLVEKMVLVGVRESSRDEIERIKTQPKVELFPAERLSTARFEGKCWGELCREIVERLPEKVYISFDIDALKIEFCHHTNAPVPGGMTFDEAIYLINSVVASGRKIVGFDITEVVPALKNKMDATVASRLLAKMAVATLK